MKHFISSLSVLCANTPPCKGRVSSRKILSLLLILFLSIGNVWGAEYQLVKSSTDLVAGCHYVIGATRSGTTYFMATTSNTNNRKLTSATVTNEKVPLTSDIMTFTLGGSNNAWTFKTDNYVGTAGYLNATSTTGSNYLKILAADDLYNKFTISVDANGVATITCNGKTSRHIMYLNGTTCFACYDNKTQEPTYVKPSLYKEVTSEPSTPAKTYDVTWMVNGEEWDTSEDVEENTQITTLPTEPTDKCAGKVFQGWTDKEITDGQKPAILFKDKSPEITEELTTFYAVFATVPAGGGTGGSITISSETTNFPTSYGTANTFTEYTLEDYKFKIQQVYKTGAKLQWRASGNSSGTGTMYNTQKFPANIASIVVVFDASDTNKNHTLKVGSSANPTGGTTITPSNSGATYTFDCSGGSYDYFVLTNGSGAGYITSITINYGSVATPSDYTTSCSGSTEPVASLTATPTTIDFGTVYEGATVADQTVAVNFANLNGDVTYSVLSTPFSATGNISTTGDNITISADASTIGEYSQTLTVASTTDSKTAEITVKMNVEEKPAPTGTFTLHTGELIEGDYVIYYSGKAMKAEVASNRLQYIEVTPSNDEIVDPAAAAIWHIAKSGANWTVYNNNKGYAAGTGTKSQAGLVTNLTGDNANKAAWTVTASGNTYEFVNVWNTSKSVNATLRNNTTYGFACYATSTGGALSLYRKAGTKYNVTVSSTTNGSVTADPTSAEAGTTITLTVTPETGYVLDALTVTDANSNSVTVTDNKFTMPVSDVTITATFKTNEKPAATLTLSKNGVTEDITGYKQDDVVTLPTTVDTDCVKEFVGWSANASCNVAPEYAAGDSYTLAATAQTLYAVYADGEGGGTVTITPSKGTEETKACTFNLDQDGYTLSASGGGSSPVYNETNSDARIYAGGILTLTATKAMNTIVIKLSAQGKKRLAPITVSTGTIATQAMNDATVTWTGNATEVVFTVGDKANFGSDGETKAGQLCFSTIEVTHSSEYSNYSTTCAAAPKAEVNPTSVTATAAAANDKVEVTYENVNTESVAVALFNDEACTEAFSADWLTASLDGDKNITYTVAATTLYTERKAYIKLTAPETTGATEPAVVVIPVIQAGKDKVFASLAELVAADLTAGDEVTVTLNNDVIKEFYIYSSKRCGVVFDVQKGGKDIKIYFDNQTTIVDWAVGGKLSGTLTNVKWTTYSSAWQLAPANTWAWANLTYTEPKAVSTVVISGAPTKTTYVDGEAFDPAGLTVTVNYNDATSEVNPTGVTFDVTPATLTKGETSVSVTATYNSVTSAAYEVTGLTVNDIPTKTVAEFIAAEGGRCYLEGIVSGLTEGKSMKYGNFDLTDATGKIYVYGCLNGAGESQKFAELGVKNGDKIKVIADEYELYGGTKDEAINVQYVSHISAATITIADITMEVEEVKTISATVEPAEAEVTYSIKSGSEYISLAGNTITALAEGTATITATVAEGATYLGNSVDFTVTVGPKTEKTNVVILAEYEDKWYAMTNECTDSKQMGAIEVNYKNGVLFDVDESTKASITWELAIADGKATFKNNDKYLIGGNSTTLNYANSKFEWVVDGDKYLSDNKSRTFLYNKSGIFKNYATSNAEPTQTDYSGYPVVAAPNYGMTTADVVANSYFSVGNDKFVQFSTGNLQYEVGTNTWSFASEQYEVIGGEAYTGSNNTNYGMNEPGYTGKLDLFAWSCDGKFGVNPSNADADYTGEFADWGNLVNETGWYTLTKDEMTYILNRKKDGKKLWALATVCGMNGLILLPDNWNTSTTLEYGYIPADWNYTKNQLDAAAWATLEAAGAVFLPEGGTRVGGHGNKDQGGGPAEFDAHGDYFHVDNVGEMGYYWLNSTTSEKADYLILPGWSDNGTPTDESDDKALAPQVWSREKRRGNSVRLVKEVTPDYERDVRQGYYGTICLENGGQMIGASLFGLSYYNEAQGLLYMDEVGTTTMTAGNPYIFLPNERATNNTLYVFYDETTAAAKTVNGLVGYLGDENMQLEGNGTNYILQDNKIKKVVGGNNSNVFVTKNRAYIQLGNVNPNEPAPIPGRRRVAIGQAPQVATGMENVDASAQPVKTIINGQLFILRGEKMYDAQGKLVK